MKKLPVPGWVEIEQSDEYFLGSDKYWVCHAPSPKITKEGLEALKLSGSDPNSKNSLEGYIKGGTYRFFRYIGLDNWVILPMGISSTIPKRIPLNPWYSKPEPIP